MIGIRIFNEFRHAQRSGLCLLLAIGAGGCSASPVTPTVTTLVGSVTDASGDARERPTVAVSPDLVSGTVEVSGSSLLLTVTLASGTLSRTETLITVNLDTDENPATGFRGVDSIASEAASMGPDYVISLVNPRASIQARIIRAVGNSQQFATVASVAVSFPAADQVRVSVPLALLGNDDGRMNFKITSSQYLTDVTWTGVTDYMPDLGLAPGVVR